MSMVWHINIVIIIWFSYLFCIALAKHPHIPISIIGKNTANAETKITNSS